MSITVITASVSGEWESRLAAGASADEQGRVRVVRRCVDVGELLSAVATGGAQCAMVDASLPGLDAETVRTLLQSVAMVAVSGEDTTGERARAMGVRVFAKADAGYKDLLIALQASLVIDSAAPAPVVESAASSVAGKVVAVWGPPGAPGRSTIAMTLADECAARGVRSMLIDADIYGASLAQMLGVLDEAPGVVAATRLANEGRLDAAALRSSARALDSGLLLLTGITRPQRWTELRPESFVRLLDVARELAEVVFVDCSSCIEQDEELFFDTMAPRRNGLTVATLGAADQVLMVASADPVGMQRAIRVGLSVPDELPGVSPDIVVNRLRKASLPSGSSREHVTGLVRRHLGRTPIAVIPSDRPACDKGLAAGRTLREVAAGSPARAALRELSKRLVPETERKWRRKRAG